MNKPTQKIIDLAREIAKHGYKQDFRRGDWAISKDDGKVFLIVDIAGRRKLSFYYSEAAASGLIHESELILVPELSDVLDWLNKNDQFYILTGMDDGAVLKTHSCSFLDNIPREIALRAMVRIMENKEKK